MYYKIASSVLLILAVGAIFLSSVSGCNTSTTVNTKRTTSTLASALPVIDTVFHRSTETAYFALG